MFRSIKRYAKKAVRTGIVVGGLITVYQAAQASRKNGGKFKWDKFLGKLKDQAGKNIKLVADVARNLIGRYYDRIRVSGKNGNADISRSAEPENKTGSEILETIREVAPEVIDKVQDLVEDVRENAPEYKARAQEFVEDVKDAAIKALELEAVEDAPAKPKEEEATGKTGKEKKAGKSKKAEKAEKDKK